MDAKYNNNNNFNLFIGLYNLGVTCRSDITCKPQNNPIN